MADWSVGLEPETNVDQSVVKPKGKKLQQKYYLKLSIKKLLLCH